MANDFQIFVKPVGDSGNLACSYCYYLGKTDLFRGAGNLKMSGDILEKYLKCFYPY